MYENPNKKPEYDSHTYQHASGRMCLYKPYWVGNDRDGHWEFGYWYKEIGDPDDYWRYCGRDHVD